MANFLIDCVHTMFYSQVQVFVATASWAVEVKLQSKQIQWTLFGEHHHLFSYAKRMISCMLVWAEHGHTGKLQISMWICVVWCTLWQKMHIYYFKTICLENECPRPWRNSSTTAMHYSIRMAVTTHSHSRASLCMNLKYERTTDGIRNP